MSDEKTEPTLKDPTHPKIVVKLTDIDGNAFAIMSEVQRALRRANVPEDEIAEFRVQAMLGDYDHLLRVVQETVTVTGGEQSA